MSVGEMQAVLSRLYVDGSFLDVFCSNPHQALHHYHLTEKEAGALLGVDREAIRKFATSLRVKTWKRFSYSYRLLYALDRPRIYGYYLRFYEIRRIRPNEGMYQPTVELGEFLEESLLDDAELPPYASELARYERLFYLARYVPRPNAGAPAKTASGESLSPAVRPVLREGVEVATFGWDMSTIEKAVDEGRVPRDLEAEPCHVVFHPLGKMGKAKKFQVSGLMYELLSLCDGSRDLPAIAAELEARSEKTDLLESVLGGVQQLVRLGLVEVEAA